MEELKNTPFLYIKNNEHIYYNIEISNKENNDLRAEFSENRTVPILNKGDDYDLAVVRFDLPTINIPIFIWKPNEFFVSITYLTNIFTREVPFISNQNNISEYGQAIWQYQDFVDCINAGYLLCFQDFQASAVYLTIPVIDRPTEPPRMIYNGITKKCSIFARLQYDITKPNPIYVYFNTSLGTYFPAFQNYGNEINPILSHYLKFKDNRNNIINFRGNSYFRLSEEWKELFLWNDMQKILFETDSIPVSNELISGQKHITRKVLTDFEPLSDINDKSSIQFFPRSDLRFYSMFSGLELRKIDMRVFWQSKDGKVYPLYLTYNDKLTIKLYFKKLGTIISNLGIF